ncbi:hypothetical protein [Pseudomonas fluorescens]|uniref:DUF4329 domain-containing protein n=1 Tax=Pseudomonas fluorescens TaxID=294 RepID=A0A5E6QPF6_PSEFL|nr:hypothetical protein [Pseudomonas fluorescens]VVM57119.1 hypothetical protein PS655_01088 [Pseudomonas fluorescens]
MDTSPPKEAAEESQEKTFRAYNPSFLTCDDAAACLHDLLSFQRGTELRWFILKSEVGRFYFAEASELDATPIENSEDIDDDEEPESLTSLVVPVSASDQLDVPQGYTVEAVFRLHPASEQGIDESVSEWSQRNRFFSISDLSDVMNPHRQYARCYLSVDGNLLSYTSKNSVFEKELAPRIAKDRSGALRMFERMYGRGLVPSSIWILLAVTAGEVAVVVPGVLWRRRGLIKASWRSDPFQETPMNERMPIFGPVCQSAREVALQLRLRHQETSAGRQSMGFILKHKTEDLFVATAPSFSNYTDFDRAMLFPKDQHGNPMLPRDFRVHGIYHSAQPFAADTLPGEGYEHFFSPADLKVGLSRLLVAPHHRLFLVTSDGAVLRFAKPEKLLITGLLAEFDEGLEQKMVLGQISPQTFIDKVAAVGTLSVVVTSKKWPTLGKLTSSSGDQLASFQS